MNENVSFNLIDEPWILVRGMEGEMREVSLMELFEQAPRIRRLANDLPTQDFAILRVLLAILQRSISPTLDDDDDPAEVWGRLWAASELPIAAIREYLDKWHGRFDLFDEEEPFMQVAGLRTERNEISSITKIIADIPDGDALFSLRVGKGAESLTYSEAARWLVHVQAFDTSGIKSGTVGDPCVKGGKSYPIGTGWSGNLGGLYFEGATLSETILLNFIVRGTEDDELFSEGDLPSWERTAEDGNADGRCPTGRADLYTWQSRRVRLAFEDGKVVGVVLTNGDKLDSKNMHQYEPMTAWGRSRTQEKKLKVPLVYLPRTHQSDRALWRGLDSLFDRGSWQGGSSVLRADLNNWLSYLVGNDGGCRLDRKNLLKIHAVGLEYGTQNSVVTNLVSDGLELSAFMLSEEGESLVNLAKECAASTSDAIFVLGDLAANLCMASGGSGADEINGAKQGARAQAFFEIDSPFRLWFAGLGERSDVEIERDRWRRLACSIIRRNAAGLLSDAGPNSAVGSPARVGSSGKNTWMTASRAEAIFNAALRKILPVEEDDKAKKGVC